PECPGLSGSSRWAARQEWLALAVWPARAFAAPGPALAPQVRTWLSHPMAAPDETVGQSASPGECERCLCLQYCAVQDAECPCSGPGRANLRAAASPAGLPSEAL